MTVAELIRALCQFPQDALVVMSKDAESNVISPLEAAQAVFYTGFDGWSDGDVWQPDREDGETEEDAPIDSVPAVCFWPVN